MKDERTFMVMGEDDQGDGHLFATNDLERAEAMLAVYREDLMGVRANWHPEESGEPGPAQPTPQ